MRITLNGNIYELQAGTGVTRSPLIEWPQNTRLTGQQRRDDRSYISSWDISDWSDGLGIERININVSDRVKRLWDIENCDTRYPSQITLSPLMVIPTVNPSRGDLSVYLDFLGQIYFCEATNPTSSIAYQFTSPNTIGSLQNLYKYSLSPGGSLSALIIGLLSGAKSYGNLFQFQARHTGVDDTGTLPKEIWYSLGTIGGSIANSGSLNLLPTNTWVSRPSQMSDLGGTLHLVTFDNALKINFYTANQAHGSIACVGTSLFQVGTHISSLVNDGVKMFADAPEGIYNFDNSPNVIIGTDRAQDKNGVQAIFQNNLYFKNKNSVVKYDGTDVTAVGYDLNDGLASDKFGEVTAMASSWKYLFAAVKGATYSHILTMDKNNKWQYYARVPTSGVWVKDLFLSDNPDGVDKLWCIWGNTGNWRQGYFLNPMSNPLNAGTYAYVATGYFTPPIFDGGIPDKGGAFYALSVTADGMGGSNNITTLYGLDGAAVTVTLGVTATISNQMTFGSGLGVGGNRIQPKFIMANINSGTTPIFRGAALDYLKLPDTREAFEFTIDLKSTAKARANPLESVIGSLDSERDSKTLLPFYYGNIGTKNVKVIDIPSSENIEVEKTYQGERDGFVRVRVAEII